MERIGREAKAAKNLRYCRDREGTQDKMNRNLYEPTSSKEIDQMDREWRQKTSLIPPRKYEAQGTLWKSKYK